MKKTAIYIFISFALLFVGIIIFTVVTFFNNSKVINTYEDKTYVIEQSFSSIDIDVKTINITFNNSDECKVICSEKSNLTYDVVVDNNTLKIKVIDERKWYEKISINFSKANMNLYLPISNFVSLDIKSETGNIIIPNSFTFENVKISGTTGNVNFNANVTKQIAISQTTGNININNASTAIIKATTTTGNISLTNINSSKDITLNATTGKITLSNVSCYDLLSNGTTGSIILNNVIASNDIHLERSTGNIILNDVDAITLKLIASTGNITGTILSNKVFQASSSTGIIKVPSVQSGGVCYKFIM